MDFSWLDRPLVTISTGRQCLDLCDKDESFNTVAGLAKDPARDGESKHIVNVEKTVIDIPCKDNACNFGDKANLSNHESRPHTFSSRRQSLFVNDAFDTSWCNWPQSDRSGRRSLHRQSLAEDVETEVFE